MKYEIYIKGCADSRKDCATCAFIVKQGEEHLKKKSVRFEHYIGNGDAYPIRPNKGQFQMELYALAWAFSLIEDSDAEFMVYSNNTSVVSWINNWNVPDDYNDLFVAASLLLHKRKINAEHISKSSYIVENQLVNEVAEYLLGLSGNKATYVF